MITNSLDKPRPLPGEFAPMTPPAVLEALKHYPPALVLWVHAQSKPKGYRFPDRRALADELGWSLYQTRKAIKVLIASGLYVVIRERTAAGQFVTFCQFTALAVGLLTAAAVASPQVTPKVDRRSSRTPSHKQLLRQKLKSKRREAHDPAVCARNGAGLPCSACAAVKPRPPLWSPPPLSPTMAQVMGTTGLECEHGHAPGRCGTCRKRSAAAVGAGG